MEAGLHELYIFIAPTEAHFYSGLFQRELWLVGQVEARLEQLRVPQGHGHRSLHVVPGLGRDGDERELQLFAVLSGLLLNHLDVLLQTEHHDGRICCVLLDLF